MNRNNNKEERCCGSCAWWRYEDIYGLGMCGNDGHWDKCDGDPCADYVSEQDKRHYTAVLLQHNRWRRDQHVPSIYRPVSVTELGMAIDFAIKYMRKI